MNSYENVDWSGDGRAGAPGMQDMPGALGSSAGGPTPSGIPPQVMPTRFAPQASVGIPQQAQGSIPRRAPGNFPPQVPGNLPPQVPGNTQPEVLSSALPPGKFASTFRIKVGHSQKKQGRESYSSVGFDVQLETTVEVKSISELRAAAANLKCEAHGLVEAWFREQGL